MRLLEEHIAEHTYDPGAGKDFLNSSPKNANNKWKMY